MKEPATIEVATGVRDGVPQSMGEAPIARPSPNHCAQEGRK